MPSSIKTQFLFRLTFKDEAPTAECLQNDVFLWQPSMARDTALYVLPDEQAPQMPRSGRIGTVKVEGKKVVSIGEILADNKLQLADCCLSLPALIAILEKAQVRGSNIQNILVHGRLKPIFAITSAKNGGYAVLQLHDMWSGPEGKRKFRWKVDYRGTPDTPLITEVASLIT